MKTMKTFRPGVAFDDMPAWHGRHGEYGQHEQQKRRTDLLDLTMAILTGMAAFMLTTGGKLLRPRYIDWLWEQDPATFFLGWHFFRNTPLLQWPLGANPAYGTDIGSSVVFSDSIPLLALLFKPFAGMLPATFQYLGLWILLCFVLQAVFASLLLARFTNDRWLRALGSAFFACAPIFLWRLYGHYAMCGQWILVAGLCLYFSPRHGYGRWILLLAVASLVHAYLLVLAGAIWAADILQRILKKELGPIRAAFFMAGTFVIVLLVMWAAGYFMVAGEGLKGSATILYRMNLLSVFDPEELWSHLLPDLPQTDGDYEGFAFPGLGMLLLTPVALFLYLRGPRGNTALRSVLPLLLVSIALIVYAASNQVALGTREWFAYPLPPVLESIAATFRATGRMVWPAVYVLYLAVLVMVFTRLSRRRAVLLCTSLLCLQLADSTDAFRFFRHKFSRPPAQMVELQSPLWKQFATRYRHVVFVLPYNAPKGYVPLAFYAGSNGMTINIGYFARISAEKQAQARHQVEAAIRSDKLDPATLYVFENDELWQVALSHGDSADYAGTVDGYRVFAPELTRR
jgi:hypothetical protein